MVGPPTPWGRRSHWGAPGGVGLPDCGRQNYSLPPPLCPRFLTACSRILPPTSAERRRRSLSGSELEATRGKRPPDPLTMHPVGPLLGFTRPPQE